LAIAEAVLNSEDHPSVQQIFERVRDHFPSMTLATIYATLDVLEKSGLIQELPFPQFSRYESNMDPHVNLVCIQCGNVIDSIVGQDAVVRLRDQISGQANFRVAWQRVDFHGWCRRCSVERHAQMSET
jgi:Fur family peroxide stress response transcriptional regulator